MEKAKNYVKRYFSNKERYKGDPEFSYRFMRHILDMPGRDLQWSQKFKIFAEFFREAERRKGTKDFSFMDATNAIFDVLSEEKFI